ncbi:hypothetical protein F2Q69_00058514 [Brassica cretica]|uniref:Uncharacterized protein n=1 Tax=Brassica cretica TaxID=69181 RepID=A0A8S9RI65_BRACR|nr:hypothetical protein F2Q69_00058514 [Brassica cretica]
MASPKTCTLHRLRLIRYKQPGVAYQRLPSCSSRQDEAVDTDHAAIRAQTNPYAPPEVTPTARMTYTRLHRKSCPPPPRRRPPQCSTVRHNRPLPLSAAGKPPPSTCWLTFPQTLTNSVFDRSKGVRTQNFDLISDMEPI